MLLKIKNITLAILFIFLINNLYSQKSLLKSIDSISISDRTITHNTLDGGWVTVTTTPSYNPNENFPFSGILVIKYSRCSMIEWSKYYYYNIFGSLMNVDFLIEENGNIMILTNSIFEDSGIISIIYLSPNGNIIWFKDVITFSGLFDIAYSIGKTSDGNYFIYGILDGNGSTYNNFILKFNSNGNIIWSKKYFDNPVWGEAIAVESGNILVRSGNLIYKVNSSGDIIWAKRYIGLKYTCKPITNNGYYTYVNFPSSFLNDSTCFTFNINTSGDLINVGNAFSGIRIGNIKKINNDNLLITGDYKDNIGNSYAILIKSTANGNIISQHLIDNLNSGIISKGLDFITLSDNSLVISATNFQNNGLFLIKTDENQTILCGEKYINNSLTAPNLNVINEPNFSQTVNLSLFNNNVQVKNVAFNENFYCYIPDTMNLELGNDTTLCPEASIVLKSNIIGNYSYLWSTGATSPQITVSTAGTYWLRVIGCDTVTDTIKINYTPRLTLNYKIYPISVDLGESISFTNSTIDYLSYYWETGDGNQYIQNQFEHIYKDYGYFYPIIHFTDTYNCNYLDTAKVEIKFTTIYAPNSYTPNGDGLNDVFDIKGVSIKSYKIYIYNRWGQLIYTAQNHGWDGTSYGTPCQNGMYYYKAEITDIFNRYTEKKGNITLIK